MKIHKIAFSSLAILLLGANLSALNAQTLPTSYSWTSTGAIISPKSDSSHNIISVKDPSTVYYNGQYIVYASTANSAGNWGMEYLHFTDWSQAGSATPYFMDKTSGFTGYHTAPQVFYFAPQNKWYLIFQSGQPQYSTNSDPTQPQNWSVPKNFFASQPSSVSNWIDFWIICDSTNAYLFFTGDNGNFYRSSTPIGNFPNGFNTPVIVYSESNANNLFEADNVYTVEGTGMFLADIECIGSDGHRFFRALSATNLGGTWTPLGNTANLNTPFLGAKNVAFNSGVGTWTQDISSGGAVIDGNDQTDSINLNNLTFLYQGDKPNNGASSYALIPWQLGLATSKANTSSTLTATPTRTNTPVPPTATRTSTPTFTLTRTNTPVPPTSTFTSTATRTSTPTFTVSATRTASPTNTPVPPTSTFTSTATRTNTPVPPTVTFTSTATRTATPVPPTATFSSTATNTSVPPTATWTGTNSPVPPTDTVTNTPVPPTATDTFTAVPPTSTFTTVPPTFTPTNTAVPPTSTFTSVPPTVTSTNTPVPPTVTRTNTPVPPSATPTASPSKTPTASLTPTWTATFTVVANGSLKVQLLSGVTSATTNSPHPQIQVVNNGTGPLALNNVQVKYWFNCDCTGQTIQAWVDWAGLMPAGSTATGNVSLSVQATSLGGQTNAVVLSFTGGKVLQPGQAIQVQARFNKSDWSNMSQGNDWSFAANTAFLDAPHVTGYLNGSLAWGQEPTGTAAALTAASVTAFPNPSTGNGTNLSVQLSGNGTVSASGVRAQDAGSAVGVDPTASVTLKVYTLGGRLIWSQTLPGSGFGSTGTHSVYWNERDLSGAALANGVYNVEVEVASQGQSSRTVSRVVILR